MFGGQAGQYQERKILKSTEGKAQRLFGKILDPGCFGLNNGL